MPPSLDFEFLYLDGPVISVTLRSPETLRSAFTAALIDTGADIRLFDTTVADRLGLSLSEAPTAKIRGVGGAEVEARLADAELLLLGEPDMSIRILLAFAPSGLAVGNLIGLDVLSRFDCALSQASRPGYLGRAEL
jgi:predicted aspartyl protease